MLQATHLLVVFLLFGCAFGDQTSLWNEFQEWMVKYDKSYISLQETKQRFSAWLQNYHFIQQQDFKDLGFEVELGPFGDLTQQQFRDQMLMPPLSAETAPCDVDSAKAKARSANPNRRFVTLDPDQPLPPSWDWRNYGAVTSVKNQGSVGTCWAFSTTGNIEGQWFLAGNDLISLSEEQLVECDAYDCSVFGGWPCRAYQYVIQAGGIESETEYPYCCGGTDRDDVCYPCAPKGYNITFCGPPAPGCSTHCHSDSADYVAHISNWIYLSDNETQMAYDLINYGPLSVLINANGIPPLQYYKTGIWEPSPCNPNDLDHAVLIVGYGTQDNTPYWTVKNSWGTSWGESGYFQMTRGTGLCGVNTVVTTSSV